ncbi:MAG: hypothetical protein IJC86_05085 [Clostridia bacterium]|nr:hypothetical protein [Clostridia bacterium]
MKHSHGHQAPTINYDVKGDEGAYHIHVYLNGHSDSDNPELCSVIENFSENFETADSFAKLISSYAALPIHIPELAEDFLLNF